MKTLEWDNLNPDCFKTKDKLSSLKISKKRRESHEH